MKAKRIYLTLFIILAITPAFAEETGVTDKTGGSPVYDAAFGFSGNFGMSNALIRRGNFGWAKDTSYGGAFIFDKIFTSRIGLRSGLQYQETNGLLKFPASMGGMSATSNMKEIRVPLLLRTSMNGKKVSLHLLSGITYSQVIRCTLDTDAVVPVQKADVLKDIGYPQVYATGGLLLAFRFNWHYTEMFMGVMGDFGLTDFFTENDNDIAHLYGYYGTFGMMFYTDLFPKRKR